MEYEPEYAKGEVLVRFRDNPAGVNGGFAVTFGGYLGFDMKGDWMDTDVFIYSVPEGMEDSAIESFLKHPQYVEYAERRDLKLERRWKDTKSLMDMAEDLRGDSDSFLPKEEYNARLREISDYALSLMEK